MRLLLIALLLAGCDRKSAAPDPEPSPAAITPSCAAASGCAEACGRNELDECVTRCARRLRGEAAAAWAALQACSRPACRDACLDPSAVGCRLCAMKNCPSQIAACLAH